MSKSMFHFYMVLAAIISFFTGELVTFLMLFFVVIALNQLNETVKKFHEDWK